MALSENNLLVYCIQEALTDPDVLKGYDSWINMLWIDKSEVLAAISTLYKNHFELTSSLPIVESYHAFLEENSRKRIEANRILQEQLQREEAMKKELAAKDEALKKE